MGQGPQKPDHRGNFFMVPRSVLASMAWRHASLRARAVLQVFQFCHDGFNNGEIVLSIKQIGRALGDQCHGANAKAVADLIALGFLECTSDATHSQSKARTYRITFISSGKRKPVPATREYEAWRPACDTRKTFGGNRSAAAVKFGGAVTTTQSANSDAVTTAPMKFPAAVTATGNAEIAGFSRSAGVAVTATHLGNHSPPLSNGGAGSVFPVPIQTQSILVPIDELREWVRATIAGAGYGGAKHLAADAGIPQPALTRLKQGRSLPEVYRQPLQEACGRMLPHCVWMSSR